jgi:hypothetical protein
MLRIKNWSKHQHFKDRTPPWIKLYRDILDDPDWHELDGDTAKVLISLWLIASEDETHSGLLPCSRKLAFRLRIKESQLKQYITKLSHWLLQDDINVISDGYQVDAPERERETEKSRETKPRGTRLSAEWTASEKNIEYCRKVRPDLDPSMVEERFKNYWLSNAGKSAVKLDWNLTWNNWVLAENGTSASKKPIPINLFAGAI